ncbi:MAG: hypothetical protein DRP68_00350 [Candidatus Omnitrophota bacterium]|nr:MAG: hypothetical protein DRP68_00350 [Candidatus Omnitrophota bacterium]
MLLAGGKKFVQRTQPFLLKGLLKVQLIKNGLRFAFVSFWYKALLSNCNILNSYKAFQNSGANFEFKITLMKLVIYHLK